jgi:triosephosphate isomerase
MRKNYIAGNWKMNKTLVDAQDFAINLSNKLPNLKNTEIIICPPSLFVHEFAVLTQNTPIQVGAQDVSSHEKGAYTSEISSAMIKSAGAKYCIVGHSERRKYHNETNNIVNLKLSALLKDELTPIFCIGESLEERNGNQTNEVILKQLQEGLMNIELSISNPLLIAYEPIWAIGTGNTATPKIAEKVHSLIRNWLKENYNEKISQSIPILYGGSVKPSNIEELLKQPNIDGGLIGGASLDIESMREMIKISENIEV